ncbi:hypothetical protein [Slackia heliotrinireducens]|nr:hypothetical protein [Slackia heliotrinireducens]
MTAGKRLERYGEIGERAYNYVENWLLENAPELLENAPQVLTLQVSQERLAREAFGGNVNQASRALRAMVEAGVLSVVKPGYKGFSTLYAYLPLPGDEGAYGWEVSGSDA